MARNKKDNKRQMFEFVNLRLSKEEKAEFTQWAQEAEGDLFVMLGIALDDGYKLSLKANFERGLYYATIIGTEEATANVGKMISSAHNTPLEAIMLTLWKHMVYFEQGDWAADNDDADWG